MELLLISNSTNSGESYFDNAKTFIREFISDKHAKILFIPFAGVTITYDEYYQKVYQSLTPYFTTVESIHLKSDYKAAIEQAEVIIVGGGNTFHLLYQIQKHDLLKTIQEKVNSGTPYIGWSAGSNLACPTIMTTNDMPVVQPNDFKALNFIDFQINAHYTNKTIDGHGGESRNDRLMEFLEVNKNTTIIGLPEGSAIHVKDNNHKLIGGFDATIFKFGKNAEILPVNTLINS